ncbi:helix-turn-helix domain-containing protein [Vampirovibrio chlorellavorus]|uniref:helix-turn-helix domain-containing protein n=1 Tax=Vampirovibrio chlorellavorus TaxID=758823 RepID=UPI003FCC3966
MTIKELSVYLKMAEKTLYKLVAEGTVPGFKVGGSWRFRQCEIDTWIKAQGNQPASKKIP